ncbi:hypothetical protein [Pseudomonas sp. FG-3G]|nr:hypothetical protein [Pseudomonas sp. FG-3G]
MFYGFIPVLFAVVAMVLGRNSAVRARLLWAVCALLVVVWATWHGSHHLAQLQELSSW